MTAPIVFHDSRAPMPVKRREYPAERVAAVQMYLGRQPGQLWERLAERAEAER